MDNQKSGAEIEFQNVVRKFSNGISVLEAFSLSIPAGQFLSILGPSGCGKTTLLRLIAGLDQPQSGTISIASHGHSSEQQFFRSFVFQEAHLMPWRTVLENVTLPLELMGWEKNKMLEAGQAALQHVGLARFSQRFPRELSGGMKMRTSIARALVTKPTLLLLDEPFAALDEVTRHTLQEDLHRLWKETNLTVVFVTHSITEAVFLSERLLVLSPAPARLLCDRTLRLPVDRTEELRSQDAYLKELQQIKSVFQQTKGLPN